MNKEIIYVSLLNKEIIAVKHDIFGIKYYEVIDKRTNSVLLTVDIHVIENHPQMWELMEAEKEVRSTILSFRNRATGTMLVLTTPDTYRAKATYGMVNDGGMTRTECLGTHILDIYEVQRQKDSQIFTVGDMTDKGQITSFRAFHNGDVIGVKINNGIEMSINEIEKVSVPILITDDDVKIYDPNTKLYSYKIETGELNVFQAERTKLVDGWLHFTSPENRKIYLVAYLKVFSYSDIIDILDLIVTGTPGVKTDNQVKQIFYDLAKEMYPYED